MTRLRNPNDLLLGGSLIVISLFAFWLVADLRVGTAMRMGPGYMPRMLCWILLGLGAVIALRSVVVHGPRLETWALRPIVCVLGAIGLFAFVVDRGGLMLAIVGLFLLASLGDREARWREAVVLAIVVAGVCAILFVKLLGLPFPIWPAGLR
jgi:putative tricarboxylic transport membrane protein